MHRRNRQDRYLDARDCHGDHDQHPDDRHTNDDRHDIGQPFDRHGGSCLDRVDPIGHLQPCQLNDGFTRWAVTPI
jgi:hypothetical protein